MDVWRAAHEQDTIQASLAHYSIRPSERDLRYLTEGTGQSVCRAEVSVYLCSCL